MEFLLQIWRPIFEIVTTWMVLYYLIRLFQGTRALQALMGLVILAVILPMLHLEAGPL